MQNAILHRFGTFLLGALLGPWMTAAPVLAEARVRPARWAQPVIGTTLKNWYQVDRRVYRSEQPNTREFSELARFGIQSVLSLRGFYTDQDENKHAHLKLYHLKTSAGDLTMFEIVEALKILRDCPGPVLVHCWHGSDRTGAVIAAYRIVFHHWALEEAIDEMVNGDFNFHETYDNLPKLLREIPWDAVKKELRPIPAPVASTNQNVSPATPPSVRD